MGKKKGKKITRNIQNSQNISFLKKIRKPLFVWVMIIIIIIIISIQKSIGNKKIQNNSKTTTGWVYDKGVGRRWNNVRYYYFFVNGEKYTGMSSYDEDLKVGDQIRVVYFPEYPKINRSWNSYTELQEKKQIG